MQKGKEFFPKERYTKYELARVLGARALQLSFNAPILIRISKEKLEELRYDPVKIAELELDGGILPISIRRPLPKKKIEKEEKRKEREEQELEKLEKLEKIELEQEKAEKKEEKKEEPKKEEKPEEKTKKTEEKEEKTEEQKLLEEIKSAKTEEEE